MGFGILPTLDTIPTDPQCELGESVFLSVRWGHTCRIIARLTNIVCEEHGRSPPVSAAHLGR